MLPMCSSFWVLPWYNLEKTMKKFLNKVQPGLLIPPRVPVEYAAIYAAQ